MLGWGHTQAVIQSHSHTGPQFVIANFAHSNITPFVERNTEHIVSIIYMRVLGTIRPSEYRVQSTVISSVHNAISKYKSHADRSRLYIVSDPCHNISILKPSHSTLVD